MSNFSEGYKSTSFKEPEGTPFYRGEAVLSSEYADDTVGLCLTMYGDEGSATVGIKTADDVMEFLYTAAVYAKLIEDGDPLVVLKRSAVADA